MVGKSRIIKAIEMGFILLGRKKKLVISTFTSFAPNLIGGSVFHTTLWVNNRIKKQSSS